MLQQIQSWHETDSAVVYDHPTEPLTEDHLLSLRLLNCLLYHWTEAGDEADCETVVSQLKIGQGLRGGGKLGGNPLFDLIFATAMLEMQNKAALYFEKTHQPDLTKTAGSIDADYRKPYAMAQPDWWNGYYLYLAEPRNDKEPLLQKYLGLSGIKQWFRKTLMFFLRDQNKMKIRRGKHERPETDLTAASTVENVSLLDTASDNRREIIPQEKMQTIQESIFGAMSRAKSQLNEEEWTRVTLYLVKKEQNQKIARIFGEDGATTSRKRLLAVDKFQKLFLAEIERDKTFDADFHELRNEMSFEIASLFSSFLSAGCKENKHA